MSRRIELAAGIAAVAMDVLALLLLLFAPLVPTCALANATSCPASSLRYMPLTRVAVSTAGWVYVLGIFALILVTAGGALAEARFSVHWGAWVLWVGGLLAFASCALGAGGVGLIYLPAILSVCLAAFASISGHLPSIQPVQSSADAAAQPPVSQGDESNS